jgi:hypothetical protein
LSDSIADYIRAAQRAKLASERLVASAPVYVPDYGPSYGLAVSRELLKVGGVNLAHGFGKVLRSGYDAGKKVMGRVGEAGVDIAKGVGLGERGQAIGKRVAQGGAAYGTYRVGRNLKDRADAFRYQHGLYSGGGFL